MHDIIAVVLLVLGAAILFFRGRRIDSPKEKIIQRKEVEYEQIEDKARAEAVKPIDAARVVNDANERIERIRTKRPSAPNDTANP